MSSCSLVIVHASLKNMVSRKTRLKFLVPKTWGRTWRDKKIHDFFIHLQEKLPLMEGPGLQGPKKVFFANFFWKGKK